MVCFRGRETIEEAMQHTSRGCRSGSSGSEAFGSEALVRLSTALGGLGGLEGAGIRVAELKGTRLGSIVLGWNRL